ncbi:transmembrane sensor [Rhizomicrobium palustre]|uniref:Transmembrane sensor n=1 Tax=Rhizomicrobium palustre TaxID=189966 RepID=A0A846N218_9PROT|nr:FecR domain-containing protein [Rhizomicrobium palustre]NIK89525.1 transmembrane sensor [Rhizomicrobium palustre]
MSAASSEIDRQAAEWAAKSDHGQVPAADELAFRRWLAADARHKGAFMKALAVQIHLEKMGKAHPELAPAVTARPKSATRFVMIGAIAASLIVAMYAGLFRLSLENHHYSTTLGHMEVVALSDGSAMTLNSGSKAEIQYALLSRDVTLAKGEALFDVAKNKLRPFRVAARNAHVRAVGTSFSVKNVAGSPIEVLVREGVVAIETHDSSGNHTLQAPANRKVIITDNGAVTMTSASTAEVTNALAWREGYIFLSRRTLAEAAAEFSRYSPITITMADPAVSNRVVSGLFKANDPVGFAKATAEAFHLSFDQKGNTVLLSAQRNKADK